MADGDDGTCPESSFQSSTGLHLSPTGCTAEVEENGVGEANSWHHGNMVCGEQSVRNERHQQDRHQGRQHSVGLTLDSVSGPNVEPVESWQAVGSSLDLRLCRVPLCLSQLLPEPQGEPGALPSSSLRAKHRPRKVTPNSRRSAEKGRMAEQKQCGPLRESGKASCNMAESGSKGSADVSFSREIPRGVHARPKLSRHSSTIDRCRGRFFCDFFAGKGGVARAARDMGFNTREWELLHGENHDLTSLKVLSKVCQDIRQGKVLAAMFAPPCSSFSIARDRTMVIRTPQYPWGLPNLPPHEQLKVNVGNACFRSAFKLIRLLDRFGLPWILENPHSSKCWYLPPLRKLLGSSSCYSGFLSIQYFLA